MVGRKTWIAIVSVALVAGFVGGRIGAGMRGADEPLLLSGVPGTALQHAEDRLVYTFSPTGSPPSRLVIKARYVEAEMIGIVDPEGNRVAFLSFDGMSGSRGAYMELGPREGPNIIRLDAGGSLGPKIGLTNRKNGAHVDLHAYKGDWMACEGGAGEGGLYLMTDGDGKGSVMGIPPK